MSAKGVEADQGVRGRLVGMGVEERLDDRRQELVVDALLTAHPYETPAYALIRVETLR